MGIKNINILWFLYIFLGFAAWYILIFLLEKREESFLIVW
ncbi:capsular polysaccharide biosynthesis protein [Thermoanaerobacterium thermosaccharolyticum]|uniref:Capsular polysaccharide biosynthesis protein n=1 Tax=Thermoanaerobacterium thermosaccharolyticum TaxID=1517 RepID=A0A223I3A0_THETR|nr:capsular polysaccharide biosynthesis protein [Thermoanaerobacterium thermosaccharolyticum]